MNPHFIFSWGDAICVRQALASFYRPTGLLVPSQEQIKAMGYPSKEGIEDLVARTKVYIAKTLGIHYKYVLITAGASHGLNTVMRALYGNCGGMVYFTAPYFTYYPEMATKNGMIMIDTDQSIDSRGFMEIIDSPSNPEGLIRLHDHPNARFVVWDGVYHNPVYSKFMRTGPNHDVMIGSFGKLLGINGIRLGWIGVEKEGLYEKIAAELRAESLGVSVPSQEIVLDIFKSIDLNIFMSLAGSMIDDNRVEMTKLEYLGSHKVSMNGMFFWTQMDNKALQLLDTVGVQYVKGSTCGKDDSYVRINLAQDRALTKAMVKAVLKEDKK